MSISKKIRIKTPKTIDGKTLVYNKENQVVYTETIVPLSAKKDFVQLNAKLPKHLQHIIEDVEDQPAAVVSAQPEQKPAASALTAEQQKELDEKQKQLEESQKQLDEKQKEIDDLKQKLADANKQSAEATTNADDATQGTTNDGAETPAKPAKTK